MEPKFDGLAGFFRYMAEHLIFCTLFAFIILFPLWLQKTNAPTEDGIQELINSVNVEGFGSEEIFTVVSKVSRIQGTEVGQVIVQKGTRFFSALVIPFRPLEIDQVVKCVTMRYALHHGSTTGILLVKDD